MENDKFVIYEIESTRFVRIMRNGHWQDASYKTMGAARAAFKRLICSTETHGIARKAYFHKYIEKSETKRHLITGKEFSQPVNTPASCDPSTETYHSM